MRRAISPGINEDVVMVDPRSVWEDLERVRALSPLVHNITNHVVMEPTANALLAIGASPVMTCSEEEVEEMTGISSVVVLNMGTLSAPWKREANLAIQAATRKGIPIIFDPCGAGATKYRTEAALSLVHSGQLGVIRGNASEIATLAGADGQTKGVDSRLDSASCFEHATELARKAGCTVVVSGRIDYVTSGDLSLLVENGTPLMQRVTGVGCVASAVVGAFAAINDDLPRAAAHAMALVGIAGEIAAQGVVGPGTFLASFLDVLDRITAAEIETFASGR